MAAVTRAIGVALAILLAPPAVRAQVVEDERPAGLAGDDRSALVEEARRAYAELDFQASASAAQRVLETPGARELDRARALEILGCALVVLDREESARDAFERLFRIDPYWRVSEPSGSPRIRRVVERVRADVVPDAAIDPDARLRLELPRAGRIGRPIEVRAVAEGGAIARVVVQVRGEGDARWTPVEARRDGTSFAVELPPRSEAEEVELYAEARDADDRVVARAGGPLEPERVPVRASDGSGSALEEPWLWLAIGGGVVLIAAIAIGVAASGPARAEPGTLPPNRVELPLLRF